MDYSLFVGGVLTPRIRHCWVWDTWTCNYSFHWNFYVIGIQNQTHVVRKKTFTLAKLQAFHMGSDTYIQLMYIGYRWAGQARKAEAPETCQWPYMNQEHDHSPLYFFLNMNLIYIIFYSYRDIKLLKQCWNPIFTFLDGIIQWTHLFS